jgi:hypothetical protein
MTRQEHIHELWLLGNRLTEIINEMKERAKVLFPKEYEQINAKLAETD